MSTDNLNHPPAPYPPGTHIVPPPRPPSPATAGFRLNHLMLRIKDPDKSLRFYNDCFGLHIVFIFNAGPWTIYYLGPRDASMTTLGVSQGLLELYYTPSDTGISYASGNNYSAPGVGFGHIGFSVPDVAEALERVKRFGYEIIKPLEDDRVSTMALSGEIVEGKYGDVHEGYKWVFRQLAFAKDPDGYWVELVPQRVNPPPGT